MDLGRGGGSSLHCDLDSRFFSAAPPLAVADRDLDLLTADDLLWVADDLSSGNFDLDDLSKVFSGDDVNSMIDGDLDLGRGGLGVDLIDFDLDLLISGLVGGDLERDDLLFDAELFG